MQIKLASSKCLASNFDYTFVDCIRRLTRRLRQLPTFRRTLTTEDVTALMNGLEGKGKFCPILHTNPRDNHISGDTATLWITS